MVLKGWFSSRPDMKSKTTGGGTLTDSERTILARLESAVDEVLNAIPMMIEAGKALHEIKARQLYRDSAATWPDYVTNRFRMSARRADQLVVFAGLTAAIEAVSEESGTVVPVLSERAVRPLAGMAVEDAKDAIRQAVADGGLTPRTIAKVAAARKGKSRKASIPRPVRLRVPGGIVTIELNKAGVASGATIATLLTAAIEAASREAA
jgi:N-acetylglucosamine kinase-like BadF-type ATPase